jgi:Protein of unknown function (DUF3363)
VSASGFGFGAASPQVGEALFDGRDSAEPDVVAGLAVGGQLHEPSELGEIAARKRAIRRAHSGPTLPGMGVAGSGRFAMIDDGLGVQLVPWTAALEGKLGQHVSGVARGDGGVDWGFSRKRGLSR